MFIGASRSTSRTPAGCNVGDSLIVRQLILDIAPRWGAATIRTFSINVAPRWGAATITDPLSINIAPRWGATTIRTLSL